MPDSVRLDFDIAKLRRDGDRIARSYESAGQRAVQVTAKELELDLEAATRSAVPGKLWRAWASRTYKNKGTNPAAIVYPKGGARTRGAMTFWTQPGIGRAQRGEFLAIPLPAAGNALTPEQWKAAHNSDLEFVERPGKAALLVAQTGNIGANGRFRRLSIAALRAGKSGRSWVPIFVLIRSFRFRNALALQPMFDRAQQDLPANFLREISSAA